MSAEDTTNDDMVRIELTEIQNPVELGLLLMAEWMRDDTTLARSYEICAEVGALGMDVDQRAEFRQRANEMAAA